MVCVGDDDHAAADRLSQPEGGRCVSALYRVVCAGADPRLDDSAYGRFLGLGRDDAGGIFRPVGRFFQSDAGLRYLSCGKAARGEKIRNSRENTAYAFGSGRHCFMLSVCGLRSGGLHF